MSSTTKDARWQLAKEIGDLVGVEFLELPYAAKVGFLDGAQATLDAVYEHTQSNETEIRLAKKWNTHDDN